MMDETDTAQMLHDLDRDLRVAEAEVAKMKEQRDTLAAGLADQLGPGGAVFVNGGSTIAYVANGTRVLDKAELDNFVAEHEGGIPSTLVPREEVVVKYPSVSVLDKASAVLSALGVDTDSLVTYRGDRRYTVQFRERED
jgi:hypothetical protein